MRSSKYVDREGEEVRRRVGGGWRRKSLGSVQTLSGQVLQTRRSTDPRQGIGVAGTLILPVLDKRNVCIYTGAEAHVHGTRGTTDRP